MQAPAYFGSGTIWRIGEARAVTTLARSASEEHDRFPRSRFGLVSITANGATTQSPPSLDVRRKVGDNVRMPGHVCPWWGGYFIDNWFRRLLHHPGRILAPYVKPGMSVMDFGCGMGLFTIAAAQIVGDDGRVTAIDLQRPMLDTLQKRAGRAGVGHRIVVHHCQRDSIRIVGPFDFILAFWSAHEVPSLRGLFGEFHGCLEFDGKLLVVEPKGHVPAQAFAGMIDTAGEVGFTPTEEPHVRLSRAVAFVRS
jgi:2-polyprenyl-3-methyl-5-hydroxy-6-metoxy-1,4-benzoquinol methylase